LLEFGDRVPAGLGWRYQRIARDFEDDHHLGLLAGRHPRNLDHQLLDRARDGPLVQLGAIGRYLLIDNPHLLLGPVRGNRQRGHDAPARPAARRNRHADLPLLDEGIAQLRAVSLGPEWAGGERHQCDAGQNYSGKQRNSHGNTPVIDLGAIDMSGWPPAGSAR
jgi:hypothetical protein